MGQRGSTWRKACTVVALLLTASGADALDCAKASAPLERAICGSTAATTSDVAMAAAFAGLRTPLGEAVQLGSWDAALTDQRIWLKKLNGECGLLKSNESRARCAEQWNLERARILTGRPEAGPGLPRQPAPFFARRSSGSNRFEKEVRVYRFTSPQSTVERLVNTRADEGLRGEPSGLQEGVEAKGLRYSENWTLSYGSPRLLSIRVERWEYNGGAHGSGARDALNFDLTSDSELVVTLIFDVSALGQLTRFCVGAMRPESARLEAGDDSSRLREAIASSLPDAKRWVFEREGAVIDLGLIDGYARGRYFCEIPYATLDPLSKRPYR